MRQTLIDAFNKLTNNENCDKEVIDDLINKIITAIETYVYDEDVFYKSGDQIHKGKITIDDVNIKKSGETYYINMNVYYRLDYEDNTSIHKITRKYELELYNEDDYIVDTFNLKEHEEYFKNN